MLYPMFVMVMHTFILMLVIVCVRIRSVTSRQVNPKYYRLMSGYEVPEFITKTSRHFENLFETPLLFYIAGVLSIALNMQSELLIGLAWAYVVCRVVHSFVHLTYNHVIHRMLVFMASNFIILAMWVSMVLVSLKLI